MLNIVSPLPITWWGAQPGDPAAASATVTGWAHKPLRRQAWVRPIRANPTPIVEAGQTEDPT